MSIRYAPVLLGALLLGGVALAIAGLEPTRGSAGSRDLPVLRRLHLGLVGATPSLEEIRRFEATPEQGRLDRWTEELLNDPRHHRYFAKRLADVYVGDEGGAFIVFRRDRFEAYLEKALSQNRPYDALVREMIDAQGLWTSRPETNFITAAVIENKVDRAKLAGRTARAFLGQRIDCAQCHDHPFAQWSQEQFAGIAEFYGHADTGLFGLRDSGTATAAVVPFQSALLGAEDPAHPRKRLAKWVTHPENRRFARATTNRIHAILVGQPLVEPVDDLPDPSADRTQPLDRLADDFVAHQFDLRHLIRAVTRTDMFRGGDFPMTPLRAEQLIGSLLQGSSARTLDSKANVFARAIRVLRETDFAKAYGESDEGATIQQALLRMNGKLTKELLEPHPFNLTGRIANLASSDEAKLEALYLAFVTRRPTKAELAHFLPLADRFAVEDVAWSLINSSEWSWNH